MGMDVEDLKGMRLYKNHPSADLAEQKIAAAISERLQKGKTLGPYASDELPSQGVAFPIGAV